MAKINKQEVIQKLVDDLNLYPGKDLIPSELADKILAVYQINEQAVNFKPEGTLRYLKGQTAGNVTNTATVPSSVKWRLDMFSIKLVTDATAADRKINVQIKDEAGNLIMEAVNASGDTAIKQTASKTHQYNLSNVSPPDGNGATAGREATDWSRDASDNITTRVLKLPLMNKNLILLSGWSISVVVDAGVAGDTVDLFYLVNESDDESTG